VQAWSASEIPIGVREPMPSQTVHAIASRLLTNLGVSLAAAA
jgi:hypothetical protein